MFTVALVPHLLQLSRRHLPVAAAELLLDGPLGVAAREEMQLP